MRTFNADLVNDTFNAPDVMAMMTLGGVYPNQAGDLSYVMADPRNYALEKDGFIALFVFRGPSIYECHIMARKEARGGNAMRVGREMLAYMKGQGAALVWGQPSIYNRAAICYIRRMGLKPLGFGIDVAVGDVQYFGAEL